MDEFLSSFVAAFSKAIEHVDATKPKWKKYHPGIGSHEEKDVIEMVMDCIKKSKLMDIGNYQLEQIYPDSRNKCDICIGENMPFDWAIEAKAFRMLGNNGVAQKDRIAPILSPYPDQRSALTDCMKLINSPLAKNNAVLIYAYDYDQYPMIEVIEMFELFASKKVKLGERNFASFADLVHPHHKKGGVFAWEINGHQHI